MYSWENFLFRKKFTFDFVEEKELLRLTNPDNIRVETTYRGPRKVF